MTDPGSFSAESPSVLDGYELIRPIGQGGFGQVWLCRVSLTGEWKALKIVSGTSREETQREFQGLVAYKEKAPWLRCESLMPIEHANALPQGFFYVMPLADALEEGISPEDATWQPKSLASWSHALKASETWFSSEWARFILSHLIGAVGELERAGLVHRDIKPENVLFLQGLPVLSDCSLIGGDKIELTRRGTPGYAALSYYLEAGGSPDMYALGALLYFLMSGRSPDISNLSARAAFWWPPAGESSLTPEEKQEWIRLKTVVLSALDDEHHYPSFDAFGGALLGQQILPPPATPRKTSLRPLAAWGAFALAAMAAGIGWTFSHGHVSQPSQPSSPTAPQAALTAPDSSPGIYPGISPERLKELDALCAEAQGKLDDYRKDPLARSPDLSAARSVVEALEKLDSKQPDADQQLTDFLSAYPDFRFPSNSQVAKGANDPLDELSRYTGKIFDWAKTDQEKTLAMARSLDFNRHLPELLNERTGGIAGIAELQAKFAMAVPRLISDREQAARQRNSTSQPGQNNGEKAAATDFANRLTAWANKARGK